MAGTKVSQLVAPHFMHIHRAIKQNAYREYCLPGGRGSTKSSFIATEILLGLMRDPLANAVAFRRVGNTLRKSVFEEFAKVINRMGMEEWFKLQVSPMEITYRPTGQKILFSGADDPMKTKSITIAKGYFKFLWFEELAEFNGMADIATIRASIIRGAGTDNAVVFYSYNPPESAACWVNEEALKPHKGRLTCPSTYLQVPREWLGEAFIAAAEDMRDTDERAYRHMYLGEVTGTGGNVFTRLNIREITDAEIKDFDNVYSGLDFGWYPDPAVFIRCCYHSGQRRLWIYDEYTTVYTSNIDLFNALADEKNLTAGEEVIADGAELKSVNDLRSYGMNCVAALKGPGSRRTSMRWLQGLKEIVIDPVRCPMAAKEFSRYEYARTKDGKYVGTFPDGDDHSIDATRYALNRVWMQAGD